MSYRMYNSRSILVFFIVAISFAFLSLNQDKYNYNFKSKKSLLIYAYSYKNDSLFFHGQLKEKSTGSPIYNMNIFVKNFRIGTVPDLEGRFKIFLPEKKGIMIFDKTAYERFEFSFKYK